MEVPTTIGPFCQKVAAVVGVGAGAAANSAASVQDDESNAYAGTHVAFEASGNALTDYQVGGEAVFDRVAVESKESHQGQADIGADIGLEAVTNLEGIGLSIAAQSQTRAEVQTDGPASMTAHDTDRGILTVDASGEGQYVQVDLEGAIGSDESQYMETQQSEASASVDVLVAVNHFSERTVAIESADEESSGDDSSGDAEESNDDETPGFGIVAALLAVGARVRR